MILAQDFVHNPNYKGCSGTFTVAQDIVIVPVFPRRLCEWKCTCSEVYGDFSAEEVQVLVIF